MNFFKRVSQKIKFIINKFFGCVFYKPLLIIKKKIDKYEKEIIIKEIRNSLYACGEGLTIALPVKHMSGLEKIKIGKNFTTHSGLYLAAHGTEELQIIIGDNVAIGWDNQISAGHKIVIGDNVLMGSRIHISDISHGSSVREELEIPPLYRPHFSKGPTIIESNVWIGNNVAILPNVIIGKNCVVGANSVVTRSFPDNCIIAGCPAKIIKEYTL